MIRRKRLGFTEQIREAARQCGRTPYRLAKDIDCSRWTMYRFINGDGGLSVENQDKLADALGLEIVTRSASA